MLAVEHRHAVPAGSHSNPRELPSLFRTRGNSLKRSAHPPVPVVEISRLLEARGSTSPRLQGKASSGAWNLNSVPEASENRRADRITPPLLPSHARAGPSSHISGQTRLDSPHYSVVAGDYDIDPEASTRTIFGDSESGPSHGQVSKRAAPTMPHPMETPAKKQSKWSNEENSRIIELRGAGMKWEDISKRLLGRSAISCRLHYQNFLERRAEWNTEKDNKLARLYDRFKKEMWERIALELQVPWRAVELRHWELGPDELAAKAGVPRFSSASAVAGEAQGIPSSDRSPGSQPWTAPTFTSSGQPEPRQSSFYDPSRDGPASTPQYSYQPYLSSTGLPSRPAPLQSRRSDSATAKPPYGQSRTRDSASPPSVAVHGYGAINRTQGSALQQQQHLPSFASPELSQSRMPPQTFGPGERLPPMKLVAEPHEIRHGVGGAGPSLGYGQISTQTRRGQLDEVAERDRRRAFVTAGREIGRDRNDAEELRRAESGAASRDRYDEIERDGSGSRSR